MARHQSRTQSQRSEGRAYGILIRQVSPPPLTSLNSYIHSLGRYGCVGKPLAMQVLRLMLARILLDFDMQFAPGFDPGRFLSSVRNIHTTLFKYPLLVELRDRGSPDA